MSDDQGSKPTNTNPANSGDYTSIDLNNPSASGVSPETMFEIMNGGMTPERWAAGQTGGGWFNNFMSAAVPLFTAAGAGALAAPALVGALGTVGGGAAAGAVTGATGAGLTGKPIGRAALTGAITGGVGAAAAPLASGLSNATGMSPGLASGLVKTGIGAGFGGLSAGLSGQNIGAGALLGGARAGISSGVGAATGGSGLGTAAGAAAGALGTMAISPLLGSGSGVNSQGTAVSGILDGAGSGGTGSGGTGSGNYDFSSVSSTLGSLLGPGLQTAAGIYGAQNASQEEQAATNAAIGTQNTTLANVNANQAAGMNAVSNLFGTQIATGNNADLQLQRLQGGGATGAAPNYAGFENTPGYQFAIQQGTQAIDRQAAANGGAYTPNTLATVGQYVTGTADQNYNNYVSQLLQTGQLGASGATAEAGNLTSLTNVGSQLGTQIGGNKSTLQQNLGQEQASGVLGASGAASSLLGGIGNGLSSLLGLGGSNNIGGLGNSSASTSSGLTANASGTGTLLDNGSTAGDTSVNLNDLSSGMGTPAFNTSAIGPQNNAGNLFDTSNGTVDTSDWLNLGGG